MDYVEDEGFNIADYRALDVEDNHAVGCIPGARVMAAARELDLDGVDALVLSACVQMPSLALIAEAEAEFGLPVISAATAGAFGILRALGPPAAVPGAGSLLRSGTGWYEGAATAHDTPSTTGPPASASCGNAPQAVGDVGGGLRVRRPAAQISPCSTSLGVAP